MVEACTCLTTTEHVVAMAVSKGIAEAFVAQNKQNVKCYRCGEIGHLKIECTKILSQLHPANDCHCPACLDCKELLKHCPQLQYHQQVQHKQQQKSFQLSTTRQHTITPNAKLFRPSFPKTLECQGTERLSTTTPTCRNSAGSPKHTIGSRQGQGDH